MKNNTFLIIFVIVLVGIAVFVAQSNIFINKSVIDEIPIKINSVAMSVVPVHQIDSFYNIQAEYPQFKSISADSNKKISDLIERKIADFKNNSKDNWDARRATATPENPVSETPAGPFDFIATWEPVQINEEYISFVIRLYYFEGGAHGVNEVHAFNYDLTKQKEITILEFLNSSQQSLDKLAELSAQQVASKLHGNETPTNDFLDQMIQDGTAPTEDNYKDFSFNYNSLRIYFQQYQVAPGSAGLITLTFYKDNLNENSIESDYLGLISNPL